MKKATPDVTDYLDFREYLMEYYRFRKDRRSAFSYQVWADELGFKDRSFLRMILTGRRSLSDANKILFIEKMDFDEIQALYFSHLVSLANAPTSDLKNYHSARLMGLRKLRSERILQKPDEAVHSEPRLLALYVLLGYDDVQKDVTNLAKLLKVSEDDVQIWLQTLSGLALVEWDPVSHEWRPRSKSFKIADSPGNAIVKEFHRRSLEHAKGCLSLDAQVRKFRSLLVALNQAQLDKLWQKFSEFAIDVVAEHEGQPMSDRILYQINFNCVPAAIDSGMGPLQVEEI